MAWTEEKIKQLKKLWAKGKSTVEIGRELGISKNAVVGKVHRLGLDSRPSPIKKPKNEKKPTKRITIQKEKDNDIVTLMDLKLNSCRWPYGDPFSEDFHFCGKECKTGKPYCPEHCKTAYTSLKELALENAREKKERMEMVMSPNGVPVLVREADIPEEEVSDEEETTPIEQQPKETEIKNSEEKSKKAKNSSKKSDVKPEKPMPKQMIAQKSSKGIPVKNKGK